MSSSAACTTHYNFFIVLASNPASHPQIIVKHGEEKMNKRFLVISLVVLALVVLVPLGLFVINGGGLETLTAGAYHWAGGAYHWAGGAYHWAGGAYHWAGGAYHWAG
jgi:uncharacterized membrane protein